ncbi:MAG: hypothetical protein JOZ81_02050 [Chloroflexi bacterium]|nr:hypothetical protein [Chloroflexota bacterium]
MQRVSSVPTVARPPRLLSVRRVLAPVMLWPAIGLLAIYAVCYVQFALQLARYPFDIDQGEGYDAWSAWLLNLGQLPYATNATYPYYSSNYPPLWSYLVSIPLAWIGPDVMAARLVSTASALGCAVVLGLAARRLAGRTLAGLLAGGFFLASPYVFHTTPLARVNSLALLLALVGISLLEAPTRKRVIFGSVALVAALFTKPTTLDAVVAAIGCALLVRPRHGLLAAGLVAGMGAACLAGFQALTGGAFWVNVVAGNENPFDSAQLTAYMTNFSLLHCVLLVLAIAEAGWLVRRKQWSPWVLYLVTAGAATVSVGKWGAGESYFLSAIAAVCVLAASWIVRFVDNAQSLHVRTALSAAVLLQGLLLSHSIVSAAAPWLPDRGPQSEYLGHAPTLEDLIAGNEIVTEIKRAHGPPLAEDPSFAVVAGQSVVGNATHLHNLYAAGLWDPAPLVSEIRAHHYGIVILNAELYPEPVLAAIGQSYFEERTVRVSGATYHLFLPGTQ